MILAQVSWSDTPCKPPTSPRLAWAFFTWRYGFLIVAAGVVLGIKTAGAQPHTASPIYANVNQPIGCFAADYEAGKR